MRILIVDDDLINQKLLVAILSEYGTLDIACNGKEALSMIESRLQKKIQYDIAFIDIMMPVMNGQETLVAIRKLESERGIHLGDGVKIVMVTALVNKENVLKAFSEGCEHYIAKPINQDKIIQIISELKK